MPGSVAARPPTMARGFSTDDLRRRQQAGHVGLALLEERVADAGATIASNSAPGSGTSIRLFLAGA